MSRVVKSVFLFVAHLGCLSNAIGDAQQPPQRPNILFAIADDWGWPHAGAYDDPVVQTPNFDNVARQGILFQNAFVSSPSCTPSRNAILTGQYHWRLGWGANLWSQLETVHATFPNLLSESGYHVGHFRKSWGPGNLDNWKDHRFKHPAGNGFKSVDQFFEQWDQAKPFCFWFGAYDPHRGYKQGTGKKSGLDLDRIKLFAHFPDHPTVRSDVADYYFEVQRFDREFGQVLKRIEVMGQLDNTLVIVTGDHGMPFPRCKSNLYDSGVRVPMAVMWNRRISPGRIVTDFVSTTDLAPTILQAAGENVPREMTGKSWMKIFASSKSGRVSPGRDQVYFGKERHVLCQEAPDTGGTPMRAIRNDNYLFIRNFRPDRWPAGTPNHRRATIPGVWLGDCDNGPTKSYMVDNQDLDEDHRRKYQLSFGKRPEFELYDLQKDPDQMVNVADKEMYQPVVRNLNRKLTSKLRHTSDPRIVGNAESLFEEPPYLGRGPRFQKPKNRNK